MNFNTRLTLLLLFTLGLLTGAYGQLTPSADAYTNTATPTLNFGAKTLLDVQSASQTTYIQFDLSAIPAGYTSASIAKATLKLYVNSVTTAGSLNVDFVNGAWAENTITANNAPALGTTIDASVPLTTAQKNQYVLIDVTSAVQAWLSGSQPNDGVALVGNSPLNATFDSKENTATSHAAELDIVFAGITGVKTATGSGLTGGGTSGTLNLSLNNTCAANQVLQWNGSAWVCSNSGTGTVTSVGLTAPWPLSVSGSPVTGSGTLGLTWAVAPDSMNTFNAIVQRDSAGGFSAGNVSVQTLYSTAANTNTLTANNSILTNSLTVNNQLSATNATMNHLYLPSSGSNAVFADSASSTAYTIYGSATSTTGNAIGVEGVTASASGLGVAGYASSSTAGTGTYGQTSGPNGVGVFGQNGTLSGEGFAYGKRAGIVGDAGTTIGNTGVLGTADDGQAGWFINSSPTGYPAVEARSEWSSGNPFDAYNDRTGGECYVDYGGNLNCNGAKHAIVPIDSGRRTVALSAIESPKNWFEDFGSAQLEHGSALVALDADFMQTVNSNEEYQVFLTPYGDCKGLYVTNRNANSFEVHELGSGTATLNFGYRVTALRRNYENVRFADYTEHMNRIHQMHARPKPSEHPVSSNLPVRRPEPVSTDATVLAQPNLREKQ